MKFLFLILAFFLGAQASIIMDDTRMMRDRTTMMKDNVVFWKRQMKILKLYNHYDMVNANLDQLTIAKNFKLDSLFDICDDKTVIKTFLSKLDNDLCLHKTEVFSITNKLHREDAKLVANIFLKIKNFDDFYKFACWVREFMNKDLFLYTMNVAVFHRFDCEGMTIPRMYEVTPNKFFNDEVIEVAKKIKMQGKVFDVKEAERMGVKQVDDKTFLINTLHSCWFLNTNKECKMNYFTEDVDLNNRYYLFHIYHPFWMHTKEHDKYMVRRGEYFLFVHKQLLARYYSERLSNGLGEIPRFKYNMPIKTGMTTTLKHTNGLIMPSRPNDFLINKVDNLWDLKTVADYERRLRDAVDKGFIVTDDGRTLHLNKPEDIELLGTLIQSNADCPVRNFYLNGLLIAKRILGNTMDTTHRMFSAPSVLEQYETALRDPMFWQLWKRVLHYVTKFKQNLKPYKYHEVGMDDVKITKVTTDERLVTFFDTCDSDISNAVYRDVDEMNMNRDKFTFIARQRCLNHRKFDVKIDCVAAKTTDVKIKIFLGPKYDDKGMLTKLSEDFYQLDHFLITLKTGQNTIVRDSTMMWRGLKDTTYTKMMDKVQKCMTTGCDVNTRDIFIWPNRLLLPKGKKGGMMFRIFVTITPIKTTTDFNKVDITKKIMIDDRALGYPIDREIDWTVFTRCTNMKMKDVVIYHDYTTDITMDELLMNKDMMYKNKDFMTTGMNNNFMMQNDFMTTSDETTFMGKRFTDKYTTHKDFTMDSNEKDFMHRTYTDIYCQTTDCMKDKMTRHMIVDKIMKEYIKDKDCTTKTCLKDLVKKYVNFGSNAWDVDRKERVDKILDFILMNMDCTTRDCIINKFMKHYKNKDMYMDTDETDYTKKYDTGFMDKTIKDMDCTTKKCLNDKMTRHVIVDNIMKDYINDQYCTTKTCLRDIVKRNLIFDSTEMDVDKKEHVDKVMDFFFKNTDCTNRECLVNKFMKYYKNKNFMDMDSGEKTFTKMYGHMDDDFLTKHPTVDSIETGFMGKTIKDMDCTTKKCLNDKMTRHVIVDNIMKDYINDKYCTTKTCLRDIVKRNLIIDSTEMDVDKKEHVDKVMDFFFKNTDCTNRECLVNKFMKYYKNKNFMDMDSGEKKFSKMYGHMDADFMTKHHAMDSTETGFMGKTTTDLDCTTKKCLKDKMIRHVIVDNIMKDYINDKYCTTKTCLRDIVKRNLIFDSNEMDVDKKEHVDKVMDFFFKNTDCTNRECLVNKFMKYYKNKNFMDMDSGEKTFTKMYGLMDTDFMTKHKPMDKTDFMRTTNKDTTTRFMDRFMTKDKDYSYERRY